VKKSNHPHMPTGKVRIYRLLFVCMLFCTVTDFSGEDTASGVKFCTMVQGRPGQGNVALPGPIGHHREVLPSVYCLTPPQTSRYRCAVRGISRGVLDVGGHVWIYGRPRRRTYLFCNLFAV